MASSSYGSTARWWSILALLFAFSPLGVVAQVAVFFTTPTGLQTCGTTNIQWTVSVTADAINPGAQQTAISLTQIGIWITNVGVAQPPAAVAAGVSLVTRNITTTPRALSPANGGTTITWAPITLPPNQNYIMYLASLPGNPGGLDLSIRSGIFLVAPGANTACLTPVVASIPTTAAPSISSTAAVVTRPSTTNRSTSPTPSSTTVAAVSDSSKKSNGGAIAGGVIGGLALLALLLLLFLCLKRRQRRQTANNGGFLPTLGGPSTSSTFTTLDKNGGDGAPALSKYGGILAAIGSEKRHGGETSTMEQGGGTVVGSMDSRRKPHRAQTSETYLNNATAFSPETTLEGGGSHGGRGSVGESAEGSLPVLMEADPMDKRGSAVHTQKSSSVTTFAQSAINIPTDGPARRVSQRSTRSASGRSAGGGRPSSEIMVPPRNLSALPDGAAPPTLITGGGTVAASGELASATSPESATTMTRTPSQRKPTRKKAPELPESLIINSAATSTGAGPPSAYYTPIAGSTHGNYSSTSLTTNGGNTSPRGATFGKKVSADPLGNPRRSDGFDGFAGAREGPVHLLMPDMPPPQQD